jgi:hypothetical protein
MMRPLSLDLPLSLLSYIQVAMIELAGRHIT